MYKFLIAALFVFAATAYAGCGACGGDESDGHTHEEGHEHTHDGKECSDKDCDKMADEEESE